jgi:transposase
MGLSGQQAEGGRAQAYSATRPLRQRQVPACLTGGRADTFAPITKRGRKPLFEAAIFEERVHTIERAFAWEDKFRRLLLRFDRLSELHYAFKTLAYTMINIRHYCRS